MFNNNNSINLNIVLYIFILIIVILLIRILYYQLWYLYSYLLYKDKINEIRVKINLLLYNVNMSNIIDAKIIPRTTIINKFNNSYILNNNNQTYVINDGDYICLALNEDINTIIYILCHELAHMTIKTSYYYNEHNNKLFHYIMQKYINTALHIKILKHNNTNNTTYANYGKLPKW